MADQREYRARVWNYWWLWQHRNGTQVAKTQFYFSSFLSFGVLFSLKIIVWEFHVHVYNVFKSTPQLSPPSPPLTLLSFPFQIHMFLPKLNASSVWVGVGPSTGTVGSQSVHDKHWVSPPTAAIFVRGFSARVRLCEPLLGSDEITLGLILWVPLQVSTLLWAHVFHVSVMQMSLGFYSFCFLFYILRTIQELESHPGTICLHINFV